MASQDPSMFGTPLLRVLPPEPGSEGHPAFQPNYMNIFFDYYWNAAVAAAAAASSSSSSSAAYHPHHASGGHHQQLYHHHHHYHPYYRPQVAPPAVQPVKHSSSRDRETSVSAKSSGMPSLMDVNFLVASHNGSGSSNEKALDSHLHPHISDSDQLGISGILGETAASGNITSHDHLPTTHINQLFPEVLAQIFSNLDVRSRGRAAQVCRLWRDSSYSDKIVWSGVEARLQLRRANPTLFPSLERRGIRRIQVLSLRRSLKDVIVGVPGLRSLNLSGCFNVTDVGLGHAFNHDAPNLTELNLSLCKQITDTTLGRIAQHLKNLRRLDLAGCSQVNDTGLLLLTWGLRHLEHLNLRSCRQISDIGIAHLAGLSEQSNREKCGRLLSLTLQDCQKISDLGLKSISDGLLYLDSLNLSFCAAVTDGGMRHLGRMPSLHHLNLRSCEQVTDAGVAHLCEPPGSSHLRSLDVSFCDKVSDPSLSHLAQGMPEIEELALAVCGVTDAGIERLVTAGCGRRLRRLHLGQCAHITDRSLTLIAKNCPQLASLDLYGCAQVSSTGLSELDRIIHLDVLNLALWHKR